MKHICYYYSPLGIILLASDGAELTGLWFENQKYYGNKLDKDVKEADLLVFRKTKQWLDIYFSGSEPNFLPPIHLVGTDFQKKVWEILMKIPYGKTMTYKEIADRIAKNQGKERMGARAVGSAVGRNRISIIVPCHRVIGTNGNLTGYAGGLDRKRALLSLEQGLSEKAAQLE